MCSNEVTTIIFDSCYFHYSLATSINHMSQLTDIEVISFHNGQLQDNYSKSKMKAPFVINQSAIDKVLTVNFGNWAGSLAKNRNDVLYIDREEDARFSERTQKDKYKNIKDSRKDKGGTKNLDMRYLLY